MAKIIDTSTINARRNWIAKIRSFKGSFQNSFSKLENDLEKEVKNIGIEALLGHLRLCGNIPESYGRDTSEEKLYSKYTDSVICLAYRMMGFNSFVIQGRAGVADVEASVKSYSFVSDAKAFRLSRTAKNQKDFKIEAMDTWKNSHPYAMVVCPIYQLPKRDSQIYYQATSRDVCIFTYSHLALLVRYADAKGKGTAQKLLLNILGSVSTLNPSKVASDYWQIINRTMLTGLGKNMKWLWREEKLASVESIKIAKKEDLRHLADERAKIMKMSRADALKELIKVNKIDNRIGAIKKVSDNGLFNIS